MPKKFEFEMLRVLNMFISLSGVYGISKIAKILFDKRVSYIIFFILLFYPAFFGHISINPKDTIIAISFIWVGYFILKYLIIIFSLFTNKNLELDGAPMKESYIYICSEGPVVNARIVLSGQSVESVQCKETYGSTTKVVSREYPFSLKYISGVTFMSETKVVRTEAEACLWQHAIEIVESRWIV